jgi:hypothetical protein
MASPPGPLIFRYTPNNPATERGRAEVLIAVLITVTENIKEWVRPGSRVVTDDAPSFNYVGRAGYLAFARVSGQE